MDINDRKMVEAIKVAKHLTIQFSTDNNTFILHCHKDKKLFHDIALAYQSAILAKEREEVRRTQKQIQH